MATNPAAVSKSRADGGAGVIASAAAVFGALDLLDEIATTHETRDKSFRARQSAEAALAECGLTGDDLVGPARSLNGVNSYGPARHRQKIPDPSEDKRPRGGELVQFPPRRPSSS
jgi:hypothetical protein